MKARTQPPRGSAVIRKSVKKPEKANMPAAPEVLEISTEYIKLESALKFAGVCMTGGEAKELVAAGKVEVNGEVCLARGKKLRDGDVFSAGGKKYAVSGPTQEPETRQE